MDFERVPNSAGLNSVKSVLVLLKYAYLKGKKKKKCSTQGPVFLKGQCPEHMHFALSL